MDRDRRQLRIWETVREIPAGRVASYGQIAEIAGLPRGARQVGHALRNLPDESDVPWFRVIRASGAIAFECGSRAHRAQKRRLEREGVVVIRGRVDMQKYRWRPQLDELLWKPTSAWDDA